MATLTKQTVITTGVTLVPVAADVAGDEFVNDGRGFLYFYNASVAPITVTIETPDTVGTEALAVAEATVVVGASEIEVVGPLKRSIYNDTAGKVQLTYSDVTTFTVSVIEFVPDAS